MDSVELYEELKNVNERIEVAEDLLKSIKTQIVEILYFLQIEKDKKELDESFSGGY